MERDTRVDDDGGGCPSSVCLFLVWKDVAVVAAALLLILLCLAVFLEGNLVEFQKKSKFFTYSKMRFILSIAFLALTDAFVPLSGTSRRNVGVASLQMSSTPESVVVISPPGGVGEVAAVKAACLGSSVRWFVVSDDTSPSVSLTSQAMQRISDNNGSLELAGASVEDLKAGGDSLAAVSKWTGNADALICTYDGSESDMEFKAGLRLATQQAAAIVRGPQVVVLGADEDPNADTTNEEGDGIGDIVGGLFSNSPKIPGSLMGCVKNACVVRHGELFGSPDSSSDFSPFVGGPRRQPVIADEYSMRTVRVDPFMVSGNVMASSSLKSCRHAVGEAAALFATGTVERLAQPISISSQSGVDEFDLDAWNEELGRVKELIASGKASQLFNEELIVDDAERLGEWLATKWAPAVMRTYDIAAIRIGARPVYANSVAPGIVEIVWQELKDFDSVMVGKMRLEVDSTGIIATREAGDASKGFGAVSTTPLPGEDVLVRRLAEAASQAVEKGLAKKVCNHLFVIRRRSF